MTSMTKRLEIDAGHRLLKHESKCRHVHGHRYAFEVTCVGHLDEVGRIIDFSAVKELLGGWLDENLDHGFIAQVGDPIIEWLRDQQMKVYVMDVAPTAENLSIMVFERAKFLLEPKGIEVTSVVVYETPTSSAETRQQA